jgi:hypothetical protein
MQKVPELSSDLVGRVERAARYEDIKGLLSE